MLGHHPVPGSPGHPYFRGCSGRHRALPRLTERYSCHTKTHWLKTTKRTWLPAVTRLPETPLGKRCVRGIDILPAPAKCLDDPGDRLLDGLFEHQFPVGHELLWHLIGILETEHIGLGVLPGHVFNIDTLWLASFAKLRVQVPGWRTGRPAPVHRQSRNHRGICRSRRVYLLHQAKTSRPGPG